MENLLEPWPWEPVLLDRVMLPAWSRRRAASLPLGRRRRLDGISFVAVYRV